MGSDELKERDLIMNQKQFTKELKEILKDRTNEELYSIILELSLTVPSKFYDKLLFSFKDKFNIKEDTSWILDSSKKVYRYFNKIKKGDFIFNGYSKPDGTYSYYDENYEYLYFPSKEMDEALNYTYNFILKLIYSKNYDKVLEYVDLILYTEYFVEETGDPSYYDPDVVIDTYNMDIYTLRDELDFDIFRLKDYAVYSILKGNYINKYKLILKYGGKDYDVKSCNDLGLDRICNIKQIEKEWIEYNK